MHSPSGSTPELISLAEAAARMGIHNSTAYSQVKKGTFPVPVFRVGPRLIKVNRQVLEDYLAGRLTST